VVTSASAIPPATAERPVAFWLSMPLNAFKIADDRGRTARRTAPSNRWWPGPKGRASFPRARWQRNVPGALGGFDHFRVGNLLRSRLEFRKPRGDKPWRMWLFLLRSAMAIASSSFSVLECAGNLLHDRRDCLRALLYIRKRSIMTPNEYTERMKRITTTTFAKQTHGNPHGTQVPRGGGLLQPRGVNQQKLLTFVCSLFLRGAGRAGSHK